VYATRVKSITNQANKNQDSEEVAKLKEEMRRMRATIAALRVSAQSLFQAT
jgi:hypothetical protein